MDLLEANAVRSCRNCGEPLSADAKFCPKCSQKYTDGRVKLRELWHDFVESVLNFDAKIFRTLAALFVPGKLTIEYFKGRHQTYLPPIRIFLMMAVFHFAIIGFSDFEAVKFNFNDTKMDLRQANYRAAFLEELDTARQYVTHTFSGNPTVQRALDTLRHQVKDSELDTIEFGYFDFRRDFSIKATNLFIDQRDLYKPYAFIFKKYRINGVLEQLQVRQSLRLITDNASFSGFLLGKLIWMVLLMMPALALVLKLLYIRRHKYFVEHLVFSFHYHAFAFLVVGIGFLLVQTDWFKSANPDEDVPLPVLLAFLVVIVYLFIAMRRVYRQGFWKTFLKYNMLNFSYLLIFVIAFALTAVVSLLIF